MYWSAFIYQKQITIIISTDNKEEIMTDKLNCVYLYVYIIVVINGSSGILLQ